MTSNFSEPMEHPEMKTDLRTKDAQKPRSKVTIRIVIERVAEIRGVDAAQLLLTNRESERVASARSLAMAACAAVGVPLCHVARTFRREWQTVWSAEGMASRRYQNSASFRAEWNKITAGLHECE